MDRINLISLTPKKIETEGDGARNLYELVKEYLERDLRLPAHQRGRVWSQEKKNSWINRLKSNVKPVGMISTYQLRDQIGKGSTRTNFSKWINDGYQRLSTSSEYLQYPEKYLNDKDVAKNILKSVSLPVQHRHYDTHEEAMVDFIYLQAGEGLTAYEYCNGILEYMEHSAEYMLLFKDIFRCMDIADKMMVGKFRNDRHKLHKSYRDTYALFYRFLVKQKNPTDYLDVTWGSAKENDVNTRKNIEWKLRKEIEIRKDIVAFTKVVKNFIGKIEKETALINHIACTQFNVKDDGLLFPTFRWLLAVTIWSTNNGIPTHLKEDFIMKFLKLSQGKSIIRFIHRQTGEAESLNIQVSKLGILNQLRNAIEIDEFLDKDRVKRKPLVNGRMGMDESHIEPFRDHGNGETILEPASTNRARGAKPLESQDTENI